MTPTPCWGCKGHFLCPLLLELNPKKIEVKYENWQTFDKRMKDTTFAKKNQEAQRSQADYRNLRGPLTSIEAVDG